MQQQEIGSNIVNACCPSVLLEAVECSEPFVRCKFAQYLKKEIEEQCAVQFVSIKGAAAARATTTPRHKKLHLANTAFRTAPRQPSTGDATSPEPMQDDDGERVPAPATAASSSEVEPPKKTAPSKQASSYAAASSSKDVAPKKSASSKQAPTPSKRPFGGDKSAPPLKKQRPAT
jgi:hypothetical protein